MARTERESPAGLTASWPGTPSEDHSGEVARLFVLNLIGAMGERSNRSVADAAGINEATLRKTLSGASWPDLRTISRLELALGQALYPK